MMVVHSQSPLIVVPKAIMVKRLIALSVAILVEQLMKIACFDGLFQTRARSWPIERTGTIDGVRFFNSACIVDRA